MIDDVYLQRYREHSKMRKKTEQITQQRKRIQSAVKSHQENSGNNLVRNNTVLNANKKHDKQKAGELGIKYIFGTSIAPN